MNEDLKKLFEGMELSEDFKTKFKEIYESHIEEETKKIQEKAESEAEEKYKKLSEEYSEYVVSEMEEKVDSYIKEEIIPSVDRYLNHVAEEFIKENKVVIESKQKVEMADTFLKGFGQIAEQYNVVIPEGKENAFAELEAKLTEANKTIDSLMTKTEKLNEEIQNNKKQKIAESVCGDMTETQKERFMESCSKVKFIDDEQFKTAVAELKESYSPTKPNKIDEGKKDNDNKESDEWLNSLIASV